MYSNFKKTLPTSNFKDKLPRLKEVALILELALWKLRMNKMLPPEKAMQCQKIFKTDESIVRAI